jgi:dATP pyrophosphohydrolase
MPKPQKIPVSTLIIIHDSDLHVLLLERADFPDHWQSVTGSQERGELLTETAARELREETGIIAVQFGGVADWRLSNVYEIFLQWRHRYPPGTTHNMEHVFGLQVPARLPVQLAPDEHVSWAWLPWREAAEKCFSWSNREAILQLPRRVTTPEGSSSVR